MDQTRANVALLYRRAGFGATPSQLEAAARAGYEATVAALMDTTSPDPAADSVPLPALSDPVVVRVGDVAARKALLADLRRQSAELVGWWVQRMVAATMPLREKLALVWHDHFATSVAKVRFPKLMYGQNQLLRTQGSGSFDTLTQSVAKDPAMLIWLDTGTDKATHPNENFSRELMERFTLGIGNYSETDVREAARCFTGWVYDPQTGGWAIQAAQHDDGVKHVLGHTGNLGGEDVVDIVTHDPAGTRFVTASLWSHLAYPVGTDDPVVEGLARGYASDLDVSNLVRNIFLHPEFTSDRSRDNLVKQPVEYVVGIARALGLSASAVVPALPALGQIPFAPPNVGGWGQNEYWLSTASSLARWRFADGVARAASTDLSAVADEAVGQRPDAVAHLLGLDSWSSRTATALRSVAGSPPTLLSMALVSPEYVTN